MFILWQRLNCRTAALQDLFHSVKWMIESTDSHWPICPRFDFLQCFSTSCPSSYTQEAFLNHTFAVDFCSRMNQCFHFSVITAVITNTGDPSTHAGCKCDFPIAQVCKHSVFFWKGGCFYLFLWMFQHMCTKHSNIPLWFTTDSEKD